MEARFPSPPSANPPVSPVYDSLTTNIPHPLMTFGDFPFPPETPLFPPASTVRQYLEDYATQFNLRQYIRLNVCVENTHWRGDQGVWAVRLSTGETIDFDALIVANGHFRSPRIPDTPGLQSWIESGKSVHSAWYRSPGAFTTYKKVVVVGGGPSARDVCADLKVTGNLILQSLSSSPEDLPPDTALYRKIPRIIEYRDNGELLLADGTVETGVNFVILATGYMFSYPFLSDPLMVDKTPEIPPPFLPHLHNSSYHVFPLAKHLFPLQTDFPPHSIAFLGLLLRVSPFPIYEAQARAIARVLADPAALDVTAESVALVERARGLTESTGSDAPLMVAKKWFMCNQNDGFGYREELNRFVDPQGPWKVPEWEFWMYDKKVSLRMAWVDVEKRGKAAEWLKDVGRNGMQDWVDLCKKLLPDIDDKEYSRL